MFNEINGTKIVIENFFSDNIFQNLSELNYIIYENFFPILTENSENKDILKMHIKLIIIENQEIKKEIIQSKIDIFKALDRFMNIKDFKFKENIVKSVELKKDIYAESGYDPNTEESREERILDFSNYNDLTISKNCKVKTKNNDFIKKDIKISGGWLGTLSTIANTDEKSYCVKVYARNRLVIKDIRADFKIDRFYLNYLVGDIFVDDLDNDELKDITKISRNAYGNQDERYNSVVSLVKAMAQKLIAEKSKIAKKNKKISNIKNTKAMKEFLYSAQESFSLDQDKLNKFKKSAVQNFRVKVNNDKRIIFISHKAIHSRDEQCCKYKPNDSNESLCVNSFLIGLSLVVIFEKIKEAKKGILNDDNFKIIFTSLDRYSVNFGENIHEGLRKEGFETEYYENTLFYACISCKYIENWNTDIEYGASWFTREKGTFCLIDPLIPHSSLPGPIASESYKHLILEKENDNITNLDDLILDYDAFTEIFIKPLHFIGINFTKAEYQKYIVKEKNNIEKNILAYFNLKYKAEIKKIEYIKKHTSDSLLVQENEE